ncbi:uncharacterized protein TNCV_1638212 [Trichonephila clavipes]|nr:uncharacterized protein TNCV_1638212 [Trichonephila clavipes]
MWYWARTCDKASHSPIPIPLGYRGHRIFRESFRLTASRVARDKPGSTLCKKSHGIPSSPRAAAVAKFRLLTGHDCLCAHLFRFNLVTSPICVLCDTGQDMTAAHLDECSALNDLNCIVKRNEKVSNHGSIPITIDCNVVAFIDFEEGFHQPIKRTKQSVFLDVTVFRHTLVD